MHLMMNIMKIVDGVYTDSKENLDRLSMELLEKAKKEGVMWEKAFGVSRKKKKKRKSIIKKIFSKLMK